MIKGRIKKRRFLWWVCLFVVLFPVPFGVAHWWVTFIFFATFAVLM